jgi:hypothetical protein
MSALTYWFAEQLVLHAFKNTAYTPPATIYLACYTTPTDHYGAGTEVTGGSYARQPMVLDNAYDGWVELDADITFSAMPGCVVSHVAWCDAVSGGNMLVHGALTRKLTVTAGAPLVFKRSSLAMVLT